MIELNNFGDFLSVEEVRKILRIGRKQAYELVNSDAFRIVRIGRSIRIPKKSFVEWLEGDD